MSLADRARTILVVVGAIGGLGGACDGSASLPADASVDVLIACADDCAPYRCDDQRGECFRACADVAQCADSFVCVDRVCVGTECTVESASANCGAYACVNGVCATNCAIAPCSDGFYCRADLNTCVPQCTRPGDPMCAGFVCDTAVGECESYCLDGELACAAGYTCEAGSQCQLDQTAPPCEDGCGAYVCIALSNRCATHCVDDADCAAPATCANSACS